MGPQSARITRADFLSRGAALVGTEEAQESGRVGGVRLELQRTIRGTQLSRVYQQVPLRVLPAFSFGPAEPALVYLLNPTAGLFEGDAHLVEIEAGSATRTVLTAQSATRIHPSLGRLAIQQWRVHVGPGAILLVLPGPAIPFRGCRYSQRIEVDLEDGASLLWGDLWYSGRYARGAASEQFCFDALIQDMTVRRQGRLIYRDRFSWRGPWDAATAAWHFGASPACGSLFVSATLASEPVSLTRTSLAAFATAQGGTCLRWQGASEEVTQSLVQTACRAAAELGGERGGCWLLSGGQVAPNHWFATWS